MITEHEKKNYYKQAPSLYWVKAVYYLRLLACFEGLGSVACCQRLAASGGSLRILNLKVCIGVAFQLGQI